MAMVEEEVVQKRKWISESEFAKEFALLKLFPGPLATMLVIRMAARKAGKWGGLAGGVVFILPAFILVLALGLYLSHVPHDSPINLFEKGIQVAALSAMTMGVWKLGASQLFSRRDFYLCALSFLVVLIWPRWEAVIILIFGIVGLFPKKRLWEGGSLFLLSLLCLKAALLCFGSGLAIIPLLQVDLVDKWALTTREEFLRALSLGQLTPGPILISVTWIGYKTAGLFGAFVTTLSIFAPGFVLALFLIPALQKKAEGHQGFKSFFQFALPAVIGAVGAGLLRLIYMTPLGPIGYAVFLVTLLLFLLRKWPQWLGLLVGAALFFMVSKILGPHVIIY